ncbi:hypothetical protein Mgra_00010090 [Meloidogyne graminicola]|uniref:Uncharacterized protein n=1 Tax=Meloidogyne graminicola TaxID=189291 RepID=A0A8S9Z638_9BILA|nr:hypothetical protein Mgra_00010090 [Meloidogyne graminicola]
MKKKKKINLENLIQIRRRVGQQQQRRKFSLKNNGIIKIRNKRKNNNENEIKINSSNTGGNNALKKNKNLKKICHKISRT